MEKIVRTNLADQIATFIQDEITKGTWKPGEKLPSESELSATLGVSRMSLRSGIQRCNALGLTETRVGEGTFVRDFSMRSYFNEVYSMNLLGNGPNEINDVRNLLQIGSVRLAITDGIAPVHLQRLSELYDLMHASAEANNLESFIEADLEFHKQICQLCKNDVLYSLYDALVFLMSDIARKNVENSIKRNHGYTVILSHHRLMLDAIRNSDIDAFVDCLMASRQRSLSYYKSL